MILHVSNEYLMILLMFIGKYGIFPLISLRDIVSISILAMMPENSGDV
jgi:Trk-type K+ transport system membrane component